MYFEVIEVKQLGEGFERNLSLRLRACDAPGTGSIGCKPVHSLHAVVPFFAPFSEVNIGTRFKLIHAEGDYPPLQEANKFGGVGSSVFVER